MPHCPKHDLKVTGCSKQVSLFVSEICDACLSEEVVKASRLPLKVTPIKTRPGMVKTRPSRLRTVPILNER